MSHANELDFPDLPPFPDDVPTAPLLRLSLQKLLDEDTAETESLWNACREVGFFYLDLRNANGCLSVDAMAGMRDTSHSESCATKHPDSKGRDGNLVDGNQFIDAAYELFHVWEDFYNLPIKEKIKYDFQEEGSYHGYKGYGAATVDKEGTLDRNEFYNVSKDDIFNISAPLPEPPVITPRRPLLKSYMTTAHAIVSLILAHLNTHLKLPPGTLQSLHALHDVSGNQTRIIKAPPQPPDDRGLTLGAHTDFGSVTLLFNRLGGLQILPPSTDGLTDGEKASKWLWVRPLHGHCIVNLGDAMVKFTRGVLRSNIHRVVNPPGEEQGKLTRMSVVYFSRPSDEVLLKALEGSEVIDERKGEFEDEGKVMNSRDWVLARALGRRVGAKKFQWVEGTEKARGKTAVSEVKVN